MYCLECDQLLPSILTNSTICSKCKTPVATWWDETSKTFRTNRESILPDPASKSSFSLTSGASTFYLEEKERVRMKARPNTQTVEERVFNGALVVLEMHFQRPGVYMRDTMGEAKKMVAKTLDLSLNKAEVRETLAKNVDIWKHLQKIFSMAITLLESRSLQQTRTSEGEPNGHDVSESAESILKNYEVLREDLHYLNNLLVISRNMLAIKETAQEICKSVGFDREVHRLIVLCVNVTSKGYDGENVDEGRRVKLNEITELYKKLLVTCLQHTHNWTMGNDRFKMSFWFEMLFDDEMKNEPIHEMPPDDLNVEKVHQEVQNWISRHRKKETLAAQLLQKYQNEVETGYTPGPLLEDEIGIGIDNIEESKSPVWKADMQDKFEQDRLYARVSHEIDIWWKKVRDANFDGWVVPMETVDGAVERAEACKKNAMHRYMPRSQDQQYGQEDPHYEQQAHDEGSLGPEEVDDRSIQEDNGLDDDEEEEEEEEDDESYAEGPLRGLLTEIPNILDTKQIEALHMTVKACIVDSMGSGLTPAGENLQKTRCKMFLALDCGRNLLRELLVFIAVWEQNDQQFIFQITAQIIESFHHNALLPFAWNSLRILKDIVSPAQTVLLRLINYMFRARKDSPIYADVKDYNRDAKLIHFLYNYFRCRVVPDCLALLHAQAQIRQNARAAADFPVDLWDMERAKDGLSQYLDFISVIAEIPEMRHLLIEWETVYEMVALLKALEAGVPRKSIDERPMQGQPSLARRPGETATPASTTSNPVALGEQRQLRETREREADSTHLQDTPHRFPWAGVKIQILIILTSLIAPNNSRRQGPGNPIVQKQLLAHEGIMPLLNCCVYDGHNEYLKERATLTIKFLMEGCKEAQDFVKELVPVKQAQAQAQAAARAAQEAQANASRSNNKAENERPKQTAKAPPGSAPYIAKQNAIAAAKAQALAHAASSGITLGASDVEKKMKEFERNIRSLKVGKELRDQEAEASSSANAGKEKKREVKIEFISARK